MVEKHWANPNSYSYAAVLHYTEAATDHELCHYYYYVTMNARLNAETNERLERNVCMISVGCACGSIGG